MRNQLTPGFNYKEAKDMIALAITADLFAPTGYGIAWQNFGTKEATPNDDPNNPLTQEMNAFFPYPEKPIWPKGWSAGKPSKEKCQNVWADSIISSSLPGLTPSDPPMKSNGAMFLYNKKLDAYCIAFAGTSNLPTTMEDMLYTPIFAGPTNIMPGSKTYGYTSDTTYITKWNFPKINKKGTGKNALVGRPTLFKQPAKVQPKVSLGIRLGLESLTIRGQKGENIIELLTGIRKKKFKLYVTGHSLGAGIASLFSAWIQAGNIKNKEISVKTYAFGSEKVGNDIFCMNYNLGLTNGGYHYVISNLLDIAPQLPLTVGKIKDLVNPSGPNTWLPYKTQVLLAEYTELMNADDSRDPHCCPTPHFFHPGSPIILNAQYPIIYNKEYYPAVFYPGYNEKVPIAQEGTDPYDEAFLRIWWQHMPWNYRLYLDHTFNPKKE